MLEVENEYFNDVKVEQYELFEGYSEHEFFEFTRIMVITQGLFDDNLNPNEPTEVVILDANGEPRMLNVERNRWHSLVCIESGSVLYESKDGAYQPLTPDEIMEFHR